MNKPARKISRKKASQPGITARRPTTGKPTPVAPDKSGSAPRFSRITSSVDLIAPRDCEASVVLKQVAHDAYRCYAWWLLVGRYDQDAMSVQYRFNGEDAIRCDIPSGAELSAAALLPHLVKFLNSEHTQNDGPPIIIGKGSTL
jgi:hypothetical protein